MSAFRDAYEKQLRRFLEIEAAACADAPPDRRGSHKAARVFAEALILCPTEDAAREQMQRDPTGALAVAILAASVATEIAKGRIVPHPESSGEIAPFFLLASVLLDFLAALQERRPDLFR